MVIAGMEMGVGGVEAGVDWILFCVLFLLVLYIFFSFVGLFRGGVLH